MNAQADSPGHELEEALGRAAALMEPAAGSDLERTLRGLLGHAYASTLAKGRFEALQAMLIEPAVLARLDEMARLRRLCLEIERKRRRSTGYE